MPPRCDSRTRTPFFGCYSPLLVALPPFSRPLSPGRAGPRTEIVKPDSDYLISYILLLQGTPLYRTPLGYLKGLLLATPRPPSATP